MKINIQRSDERGHRKYDWLDTRYSFSFSDYYDPRRINFGTLRVLNQDIIEPGKGFPMHSHDNMEIVTIILEGSLEHKDSIGNHGIIKKDDVQRMSAGSGVTHSEFNHSKKEKVHLLQIWIFSKEEDIKPSYEQKHFNLDKNKFITIVGKDGVYIHQDAMFLRGIFDKDTKVNYKAKNNVFVFVINGNVNVDKYVLTKGDSAEISEVGNLELNIKKNSDILIIDMS